MMSGIGESITARRSYATTRGRHSSQYG